MNQLEQFKDIDTFLFDVDGVLTNSQLLVLEDGKLLRQMNVRDGYALKQAIKKGYRVAVITGGKSEGVKVRLQNLGIVDVYLGASNKIEAYEELIDIYELNEAKILYMGDDMPDYEVMRRVGLPVCPADADKDIMAISLYISPLKGGQGCVRDVIEKVLKLNGNWSDE
jgi:3-deoxy-D-manno-octulosonate 8-phosphate phosphatase (KDO 8-P phosphatase)